MPNPLTTAKESVLSEVHRSTQLCRADSRDPLPEVESFSKLVEEVIGNDLRSGQMSWPPSSRFCLVFRFDNCSRVRGHAGQSRSACAGTA